MAEYIAQVPILTANNSSADVGIAGMDLVGGGGVYGGNEAYMVFDGNEPTTWSTNNANQQIIKHGNYGVYQMRIWFSFVNTKEIVKAYINTITTPYSYVDKFARFKIQYSDDGSNWIDINEFTTLQRTTQDYEFVTVGSHKYWAVYLDGVDNNKEWAQVGEIQFYTKQEEPGPGPGPGPGPEPEPGPIQPDNGITSTFFVNSSAENVLNKSLTEIKAVKYQVWEPFDILNPTLIVRRDDALLSCNYVYIPKFGRYYFAKVRVEKGNQMVVECNVDPLESWKDKGLMSIRLPIVRQQNKFNMYITDNRVPFLSKGEKQIMKISGGDSPFLTSSQDTGEHFLLNSL